jgi:poly-gamma-glutamate capsule biosynthesis protein CapA/YwtB (metallophosphatase superfamily)
MSVTTSDPRRAQLASRLLVGLLVGIFLLGLFGFIVAVLAAGEAAAPASPSAPPSSASQAQARRSAARQPVVRGPVHAYLAASGVSPVPTPPASVAGPSAVPVDDLTSASPAPLVQQDVPVVPVARFWSPPDGLSRRDLVRALETGRLDGVKGIAVEDSIHDALAASLGISIHPDVRRGSMELIRRVARRGGLGLVAASALRPSLRPLAVDGRTIVGNDRVRRVSEWPLLVTMASRADATWDQARTWVLVAGGDSFTDRGVYDTVVRRGQGVDFPFGGGTARVTGHGCCDPVFHDNVVPRYRLTGNKGRVRKLFRDADLAIVNHEMPTTPSWGFHASGFTFSGRPDLTRMFTGAGIDWVSLANNHIKDYGSNGIADTRRVLRRYGLGFGGAGKDLEQARRISYLEAGGVRLAIIPCVDVAPAIWAGPTVSGATPCKDAYVVKDIKRARREADLVIVFPHWGVEYSRQPLPSMRKHAGRWIKAGADLIVGAHSHVAGAIEEIDGVPVLYSLGNLIFDQHWSTNTMESAFVEATFHGHQLVALELHPYIVHATSQPNLLDPARGEGRPLRGAIRKASAGWLDW